MVLQVPRDHPDYQVSEDGEFLITKSYSKLEIVRFSTECRKKFRVCIGFPLLLSVIG